MNAADDLPYQPHLVRFTQMSLENITSADKEASNAVEYIRPMANYKQCRRTPAKCSYAFVKQSTPGLERDCLRVATYAAITQ